MHGPINMRLERHSSFGIAQKTVGLIVQVFVYMATGGEQENRAYWYLVCRGPMKAMPHRYQTILLLLIANQSVLLTLKSITRQSIETWTLHRESTHSCARRGFADRTDAIRNVQNRYFSLRFLIFPFLRLAIMQICCRIYYMAALRCQRVETWMPWAQTVRLCVRLFKQECKILCINPKSQPLTYHAALYNVFIWHTKGQRWTSQQVLKGVVRGTHGSGSAALQIELMRPNFFKICYKFCTIDYTIWKLKWFFYANKLLRSALFGGLDAA